LRVLLSKKGKNEKAIFPLQKTLFYEEEIAKKTKKQKQNDSILFSFLRNFENLKVTTLLTKKVHQAFKKKLWTLYFVSVF
jgi:hypothetical protein